MFYSSKKVSFCLFLILFPWNISFGTEFPSSRQDLEKQYNENFLKATNITNGKKSMPYSLKALEYALALKDDLKIGNAYNEISADYERMGNLTEALRFVFLTSQKYEKLDFLRGMGSVYNRIGSLYAIQKNKNLAIYYLEKAITYHKKGNNILLVAYDLNNLGEVYRVNANYKEALDNFRESFNISLSLKDNNCYAYAAGNIGLVYAAKNLVDSSNYYLRLSTEILIKKGDYYPIAVYEFENAKILFSKGKTFDAIKNACEAKKIAERENLREQLCDVNKLLADIYLSIKDYKNAYISLNDYYNNKDSLNNSKVISDMAELRADFEVTKKQSQIKVLESINKLRNRINWTLGAGLFIVFALTIFLVKANKQKNQSNRLLLIQKSELEQKNEIINASLVEKETLLKEIHHRVKNNLQIISSLLSLQSRNMKNKKALEAFSESQRRLHSIALVHQKLYQNENLSRINIKEYLNDLVDTIHQSFYSPSKNISYEINITDINFDVDTAVPIGLIVNELVTNSYKYAFVNSTHGIISINLHKKEKSSFILNIKDSGKGLPNNFNINELTSLGMKLVNILTRQIDGKLEIKSENGAEFNIEFVDVLEAKV